MAVLVAYASAYGSTREIAERIGDVIRRSVPRVDVRPIDQVTGLSHYDALVLGSAVHNQAWLPSAEDFVRRNAGLMSTKPLWMFSVGMPAALRGPMRRIAATEEHKLLARFQGVVKPAGHRLFSGVIAAHEISKTGRIIFLLMGGRYGDYRDWAAIERWADGIGRSLSEPARRHVPARHLLRRAR
ncbi:flavodoxin domain-containing protein [Actinocrinis puniceicyclus]|uniref:Flavodoxin domain-containing protein n=1 Tax=Actinocrinis puniceicyclus TaxID=977794 RepID=A0A8J7WH46_9ACTN|nr:flavodoxin domain-containing protein [Actinocrinis puniceicyclus]MBS2962083.1 flavodoxin domain-containing protein [Actinocrinis puniceicyclus]